MRWLFVSIVRVKWNFSFVKCSVGNLFILNMISSFQKQFCIFITLRSIWSVTASSLVGTLLRVEVPLENVDTPCESLRGFTPADRCPLDYLRYSHSDVNHPNTSVLFVVIATSVVCSTFWIGIWLSLKHLIV